MFQLYSENLTGLGGSMGTEHTWANYVKFFISVDLAKEYAETGFGNPIKWKKFRDGYKSPDLRYVMYYISKIKVEA